VTASTPKAPSNQKPASSAPDPTSHNVGDDKAGPTLLENEPPGTKVCGGSACGSRNLRRHTENQGVAAAIKPMPLPAAV
jgi:hypothetical protein